MSETQAHSPDDLEALALLYTTGAGTLEQLAAFERLLAEDQGPREALIRVVGMLHGLGGQSTPQPNASYRAAVRQRLGRWNLLGWLFRQRSYRGHPLVWTGVGAVGAAVLLLVLTPAPAPLASQPAPVRGTPLGVAPPVEVEQAHIWADMPRGEHLRKAHDEEQRKRLRNERLSRLAQTEDIRLRGVPSSNRPLKN